MKYESMKSGDWYMFHHARKGEFLGRFVGLVEMDPGDVDPVMLDVEVWTQDGSGQERLANNFSYEGGTKHRPPLSRKHIRPSLLASVEHMPKTSQEWLKNLDLSEPRAPEGEQQEPTSMQLPGRLAPAKGFFGRLLGGNE